jgi:hypothetical protein
MPAILNANAVIGCSHGGTFKFIPSTAPTVLVGGASVVTSSDQAVPETPCPFATAAGPAPCVQLTPPITGLSASTQAHAVPVLLATAEFMTIAAGAGDPTLATVVFPGQELVQAT